ncbi:UTP8 [Candida pseudojiufengensis]|uniref:UTP8 n=1 Tax=Candida pseudojiufengensis TaxID=497109 RepID=UPI0022246EF6|nr:UTP8 [Candida pseudojiufengensis]KAI5959072.1 UTP8 [Candida pseudojiufengensis]
MSIPSLSNQYPITTLPRVSGVPIENKLLIPQFYQNEFTTNTLDFAISKSMICSYLIKPTPKLLWSFALKPSYIVDCIDVLKLGDEKIYVVGITERNLYKIIIVKTSIKLEDGIISADTLDTNEYKIENKVVGIKISNSNSIVVVYQDGKIEFVNFKNNELIKGFNFQNEGEIIYNQFINDLEDNLLLVVSKFKTQLIYKILSINQTKPIFEIQNFQNEILKDPIFTYISGNLYQYHDGIIDNISIPNFKKVNSTSVSSLIQSDEKVSIKSPAPDRILLGNSNKLYLLNLKFGAKLSEFKSISSSSNPVEDKVFINQIIPVKGSSQNTSLTNGFYLNLKNKDNNLYLNIIDINVGLNKLNECLGKSINQRDDKQLNNIRNIYNDEPIENESTELNEIYEHLKIAQEENNLNKWESILIPYLKNNKSWNEIKQFQNKSHKKDKIYQFKEFDVENDRIININFINLIFELIFNKSSPNSLNFKSLNFIPEYTLMYLLTNPIFPKTYTRGLLKLFYNINNLTLLKQAIITCSNLEIEDLVNLLIILGQDQEDILSDLITRIIDEFSPSEITKSFKKVFENSNETINIIEFINKILKVTNYNKWKIIEILIDINGLFNWNLTNIEKLNDLLDSKIKLLTANSYNLTLIDQVNLKRNTSKKQQTEVNGILTITDQTKNKKLSSTVDLNDEKIPLYSIETLEI